MKAKESLSNQRLIKNPTAVPRFKDRPKAHLCGSGLRVRAHQENLHCSILLHGERQREVAERIKGYRHLGTLWAHQGGLEKTVENIDYYGVVTQAMVGPGLLGNNLIGERKKLLKGHFNSIKNLETLSLVFVSFMRRSYLIRTALGVSQGKIRLLLHTVQIFMEPIQQEGQQLLGVLLLVARELRGKTPDLCLKTKPRLLVHLDLWDELQLHQIWKQQSQ